MATVKAFIRTGKKTEKLISGFVFQMDEMFNYTTNPNS